MVRREKKKRQLRATESAVAEAGSVSSESVHLDLAKVKIESLFEDLVDFDTFSKSDFRVVKIEACEAVPKSKKLLKFILNDGTERRRTILSGIHDYCHEPDGRIGRQNLRGHYKPASQKDDGHSV